MESGSSKVETARKTERAGCLFGRNEGPRASFAGWVAETLVYWLLPPACREEVLGDMRERRLSLAQYLMEAACTVPAVIYSRIRRTTDGVVALMQAMSMYAAFVMAAWWLRPQTLFAEYGFARLAIPAAIILIVIVLTDAYGNSSSLSPVKPLLAPVLGLAVTYAIEIEHRWSLPAPVLACGGALSVLLASTLRLTFRPLHEARAAKIPPHWQKLELPASGLKYALPAVVAALILYLVLMR